MSLFPFQEMDDIFGQMNQMMGNMNRQMNQMNQRMAQGPFGGMGFSPFGPMGMGMPFGGGFPMLGGPMGPMPGAGLQLMAQPNMAGGGNNGSFYSSQSVISFSGNGAQPQVYEETHMNRVGPNGVREERKTVRDSRSGLQQMSIGRHINERGHVIEKKKNRYTGDEEENNEYINIDEEEAPVFNEEWNRASMASASRRPPPMLAITNGEPSRPSTQGHVRAPTQQPHHGHHLSNKDRNKLKIRSTTPSSTSSSSSPSPSTNNNITKDKKDKKDKLKRQQHKNKDRE